MELREADFEAVPHYIQYTAFSLQLDSRPKAMEAKAAAILN